jgi:hypothetical protein
MTYTFDPPVLCGKFAAVSVVRQRFVKNYSGRKLSIIATKKPIAILLASKYQIITFGLEDFTMDLDKVELLCPGVSEQLIDSLSASSSKSDLTDT